MEDSVDFYQNFWYNIYIEKKLKEKIVNEKGN